MGAPVGAGVRERDTLVEVGLMASPWMLTRAPRPGWRGVGMTWRPELQGWPLGS